MFVCGVAPIDFVFYVSLCVVIRMRYGEGDTWREWEWAERTHG